MPTEYSATQIIGATMYAKKRIELKTLPQDNAPVYRVANAGDFIGIVYSYLEAGPGRSSLYWMYYDSDGAAYYAPHRTDTYELTGVGSVYPEVIADDVSNWFTNLFPDFTAPFQTQIGKYFTIGAIVYMVAKFGPDLIKNKK
jgi:hypothetical protein